MSRRVPKSICRAARVVLIVFETGGGADAGAALGVFLPNGFGDDSFDCISLSKAVVRARVICAYAVCAILQYVCVKNICSRFKTGIFFAFPNGAFKIFGSLFYAGWKIVFAV